MEHLEESKSSALYESDRIVGLAMDFAEKLLEKGAQIQRVENTIVRICLAYGAKKVEPFAITSLVQASVLMPDGYHTTQIRRVYETTTDLGMLLSLAQLIDRMCRERIPLDKAEELFSELVKGRKSHSSLDMLGMALGAGGFALAFGGDFFDFFAAALIGFVIFWFNDWLTKRIINALARTFIDSLLSGIMAVLLCAAGIGHHLTAINTGTIMLFITGILFGNALRDLLCGDLVAGMLKLMQALLTAVAIAVGYSIALWFSGFFPTVDHTSSASFPYAILFLATAVVGPVGFCILYRLPFRYLPLSLAGSVISYGAYALLTRCASVESMLVSNLIATIALSVYCETTGGIAKTPVTLYTLPALVPLAPGYHLYYATFYLVQGNTELFWIYASNTLNISLGIAVGIVIVSLLIRIVRIPKFQRHLHKTK